MEPQKRIITEPVWMIREAARRAMKGRMPLLIISSALCLLCISVPVVIVEQITGLWDVYERAVNDYLAVLGNMIDQTVLLDQTMVDQAALQELALSYADKLGLSAASFIYLVVAPGPLTLGLSSIWLLVLRSRDAYTDMVFSGFANFIRVVAVDAFRRMLLILCVFLMFSPGAFLLVIPGSIIYYRYNLALFLLADNPSLKPQEALSYSRYYMNHNKMNRFILDLSFIGWFALSTLVLFFVHSGIIGVMIDAGSEPSLFTQFLVLAIAGSLIYAPVFAYRGMAAAEYYHRVICRDPQAFPELPMNL